MIKFNNPLLVLRGAESEDKSVIIRALEFARLHKIPLKVIKVIEEIPKFPTSTRLRLPPNINFSELVTKEIEDKIKKELAIKKYSKVPISIKILIGKPFIEIIREVLKGKHDLVITSAEGGQGTHGFFGSANLHLLRKCPCPVWIIKPKTSKKYRNILVTIDMDPEDAREQLSYKLVEYASLLAKQEKSKLYILHVWRLHGEEAARHSSLLNISKVDLKTYLSECKTFHQDWMNNFLKAINLKQIKTEALLVKGEASKVIPKIAKKLQIDLIVMGTVCRTGIAGLIIGNTAENVLQQVTCSVIAVKPDTFKTPIA